MTNVIIEGVFMNAEVKTKTFEGNSTTNLYVDVYQKDSNSTEKTVTLKTDDVSLINKFHDGYDLGTAITVSASVSAYKNKAYFKLLDIIG